MTFHDWLAKFLGERPSAHPASPAQWTTGEAIWEVKQEQVPAEDVPDWVSSGYHKKHDQKRDTSIVPDTFPEEWTNG